MENNNNNNSISCSSGRVKMVDPNDFNGFKSSSNIPVALEDLNIFVKLTSFRKARTLLTGAPSGKSNAQNLAQISVNFIDGSIVGGKKVLTTKYTDLTTVFETEGNDETLGITSIDIEFNPSYTPLITINFVDVRGSSIFQNEEKILGNKGNKYTTFFQLPYPMFELEIKGFYGLPVKYCLHLYKFNSKFNSQTGNFEITANFIGFTFAMMSDMLLGYLRAIPNTRIGAERFDQYKKDTGRNVLTLDDLCDKINQVNQNIQRVASESPNSKELNSAKKASEILILIKEQIRVLSLKLNDLNSSKPAQDFIIFMYNSTFDVKTAVNEYTENLTKLIAEFNEIGKSVKLELKLNDFTNILNTTNTNGGKFYNSVDDKTNALTFTKLNSTDNALVSSYLGSPANIDDVKKKIIDFIGYYYKSLISDNLALSILDMSLLIEKIDEYQLAIDKILKEIRKNLAEEFSYEAKNTLRFEPTIRPIVECFTAAIEVLVESIYIVSENATKNPLRTQELSQKFTSTELSDLHEVYVNNNEFFPWPDYREKDESKDGAYVDKYLGATGVLKHPERVDELVFIDELLMAFRESYKSQQETIQEAETATQQTWLPINPLDTLLFNEKEPYARFSFKTYSDIYRLMVIRALVFFGYSYSPENITEEQINAFVKSETDSVLKNVKDEALRLILNNASVNEFKNVQGEVATSQTLVKVLTQTGSDLKYDYIFNGSDISLLPINEGNDVNTLNAKTYLPTSKIINVNELKTLRNEKNYNFLTNYTGGWKNDNDAYLVKKDDGGTYVKIFYNPPSPKSVSTDASAESLVKLSDLKIKELNPKTFNSSLGFNCFGGEYGVLQFKNLNWESADLEGLPAMFIFYAEDSRTGLSYTRQKTYEITKDSNVLIPKYGIPTGNKMTQPAEIFVPFNVFTGHGEQYRTPISKTPVKNSLGKNRVLFNKFLTSESNNITYPYLELDYQTNDGTDPTKYDAEGFSLFGSDLYYAQAFAKVVIGGVAKKSCEQYSKAYLFLRTLPFNITKESGILGTSDDDNVELVNLFRNSSGIIEAPRLWCAYVGSELWRQSEELPIFDGDKIIGGGCGPMGSSGTLNDPIYWKTDWEYGGRNKVPGRPERNQFFPKYFHQMDYVEYNESGKNVLSKLPDQIKNEFKQIFFDFVNGTGGNISWRQLADELEIFDTTGEDSYKAFRLYLNYLYGISPTVPGATNSLTTAPVVQGFSTSQFIKSTESPSEYSVPQSILSYRPLIDGVNYDVKKTNVFKNYSMFTPIYSTNINYIFLELKETADITRNILNSLVEKVYIANTSYNVWRENETQIPRRDITIPDSLFTTYFTKVANTFKGNSKLNPKKEEENMDTNIFGTANKDLIRLQLYRNCKNIYDKWLGGAKSVNDLVFQCGGRSSVDYALAEKYKNTETPKARMIDSFRFVSRSFRDIGNELYVNPLPINEMLIGNVSSSSYDMISKLLSANNFTFHPLPNFINFRDDKVLASIFKPYNYATDLLAQGSCGPSFVCVYVGQTSKHLDYGDPSRTKSENQANYPNDGFDLRCSRDSAGNKTSGFQSDAPDDFIGGSTGSGYDVPEYEEPVSAFVVKYSQQNQNIFKDIHLDQSEHSETDESLQIQDELTQKGAQNNRAIVGQNVYSVYAVRSYTAKVEMMGNAMIQPMMFFQLDNIPMFHGAYLITKVNHSLKANSMSTNFSGTRIRYPETPLITSYDVYFNMIDSYDTSAAGIGPLTTSGSFEPIVATLFANNVSNAYIEFGKKIGEITTKEITATANDEFYITAPKKNSFMITEAADAYLAMIKEFISWMKQNGFKPDSKGKYIQVSSLYRDFATQAGIAADSKIAAKAGTSYHGWGLAVDMFWVNKNGKYMEFNGSGSIPSDFNYKTNPGLQWLYENSARFGFISPSWARDSSSYDEAWHWEYHGTSAKCLIRKNPVAYNNSLDTSKPYEAIVKNPKTPDGKEAVYSDTDCNKVFMEKKPDKTTGGSILDRTGCPPLKINGKDKVSTKDMYTKLSTTTKLNKEAIAGIMGNWFRESGFQPEAFNHKGGACGAYGLAQWRGERIKNLEKLATSKNKSSNDYEVQIEFLYQELSTLFKYTLSALEKVKTYEEAVKIFYMTYEFETRGTKNFNVNDILAEVPPNADDWKLRLEYAKKYYNMITTNQFV